MRASPSEGRRLSRRGADVSVIIPTFNRVSRLRRAIESILGQTLSPREVWVVDDGSTDGTSDVIRADFPDVNLVRLETNRGVSHARNRGAERASGRLLAFLDSDDLWLPHKLERQMAALESSTSRICHSDEIWIRRGVRVNPMNKHRKQGGFIFKKCLPLCALSPSSVVVDRRLFLEVGGFDESLPVCEDYDLWLRLCWNHEVTFVAEPLVVKHGGHDDQLSRRYWGMDRFRVEALTKILAESLAPEDRLAALETVIEKLAILANGADKRQKHREASEYRARRNRFQKELDAIEPSIAGFEKG